MDRSPRGWIGINRARNLGVVVPANWAESNDDNGFHLDLNLALNHQMQKGD
jgi:hypothetical protein